jgi:hypothetical protein
MQAGTGARDKLLPKAAYQGHHPTLITLVQQLEGLLQEAVTHRKGQAIKEAGCLSAHGACVSRKAAVSSTA